MTCDGEACRASFSIGLGLNGFATCGTNDNLKVEIQTQRPRLLQVLALDIFTVFPPLRAGSSVISRIDNYPGRESFPPSGLVLILP